MNSNSLTRRGFKTVNLSKLKSERKKRHNQTQKLNRRKTINEKRNIDIDEITEKLEKTHLGKTIEILAAIWAHGGQCVIGKNKDAFFIKRQNVQTNILGLGYSGVCNISNSETFDEIDKSLRVKPSDITTTNLTEKLLFNTKNFIKQEFQTKESIYDPFVLNDKEENNQEYFSLVENYDSKRCNKLYGGYKPNDPLIIHDQIKNGKVLVRIYSMRITSMKENGETSIPTSFPHDIYLNDNSTLNDVVDVIIKFVNEHSKLIENKEKIVIHLFDSSCNYTEDAPNLAFTDTKKQRQNKHTKRTNVMQERIKDLTLNLSNWGIRSKSKETSPRKTSSRRSRTKSNKSPMSI